MEGKKIRWGAPRKKSGVEVRIGLPAFGNERFINSPVYTSIGVLTYNCTAHERRGTILVKACDATHRTKAQEKQPLRSPVRKDLLTDSYPRRTSALPLHTPAIMAML